MVVVKLTRVLKVIAVFMGFCFLLGCTEATAVSTQVAIMQTAKPSAPTTFIQTPTLNAVNTAVPTTTPLPTTSPTITAIPSATPDLYQDLTIDALAQRGYGGGELAIIETIEKTALFTRYLITYPSDGLTIYGYMNVPNEGNDFPVVIMLHGYMPVDEYETVTYTKRYADDLAEAGFLVIHPSFRNHPPSDTGSNPYRIGYAVDVLNLIAVMREQSQDDMGYLRRANTDEIHLWGHSMGGGVALRVVSVLHDANYLKTAVFYGAMSGDEKQNYEKIEEWRGGRGDDFELSASPAYFAAISPMNHLEGIHAVIQVHHSFDDDVVPVAWSEDLCAQLDALELPHDCYFYTAVPHTFRGLADLQFMERVRLFYGRH